MSTADVTAILERLAAIDERLKHVPTTERCAIHGVAIDKLIESIDKLVQRVEKLEAQQGHANFLKIAFGAFGSGIAFAIYWAVSNWSFGK